ncbi:MAG: glycine cleavage system protein GcvH [Cyanobacteria bacterium P01_F01_bin.42]
MSFEYPSDLKYLDSHEYVRIEGDIATIGITAFAVDQLGDIVFVELPEEGDVITQLETFGNVESVKAVEELVAPVTGTVIEQNTEVLDAPEKIAEAPYEDGWFLKVKIDSPVDPAPFLSAQDYSSQVEGEGD